MKKYYVYIMTNKNNTVLYTGVTGDLKRRIYEHKNKLISGFTKKYNCTKLVWYQDTQEIDKALETEKRMKKWKRDYKINVINEFNPEWRDLFDEI